MFFSSGGHLQRHNLIDNDLASLDASESGRQSTANALAPDPEGMPLTPLTSLQKGLVECDGPKIMAPLYVYVYDQDRLGMRRGRLSSVR